MLRLAAALARRGRAVDLVVAHNAGPCGAEISPGVRLVDLGARHTWTALPALIRYLLREKPAAMISALERANLVALVSRALCAPRLRLVISIQNTLSVYWDHEKTLTGRVSRRLAKRLYPSADTIAAVSAGVADDLASELGIGRGRIDVIYNPVITDTLFKLAAEPAPHPWLVSDPRAPTILAVNRLMVQKDYPTMLRAFALLRSRRAVRLIILGEGEERASLERLARDLGVADDLSLPGFVPNPFAYMARADLFVLSSQWEGLPTVLIEAMACGSPVVSTDCPSGPREILLGGELGRLVPVSDPPAFAEAMDAALDEGRSAVPAKAVSAYGDAVIADAYLEALGLSTKSPDRELELLRSA